MKKRSFYTPFFHLVRGNFKLVLENAGFSQDNYLKRNSLIPVKQDAVANMILRNFKVEYGIRIPWSNVNKQMLKSINVEM